MKKTILKIIIINLILIFGINAKCFAAKNWSEEEFEKLMETFGYGTFDIEEFNFTGSNLSIFISSLSNESNSIVISKFGSNSGDNNYKDDEFVVYMNSYTTNYVTTSSNNYFYIKRLFDRDAFFFNTTDKTVTYKNIYSDVNNLLPYIFWKKNNNVSEEEFNSNEYRKFLIKNNFLLFSDHTIKSADGKEIFIPKGGKIISSSYEDIVYKGEISYGPTTKTATITYTSGFEDNKNYDLFLEQYKLDNDYENGVSFYPIGTIDLGEVTTNDTSIKIDINNFMDSSYYVYKLCLGKNKFNTSGENDVYLCSNWLVVNDNSVRAFYIFSQSHYMQFLSLVSYDINYQDPINPGISSGDNNITENFEEVKKGINGIIQNIIELPKNIVKAIGDFLFAIDQETISNMITNFQKNMNENLGLLSLNNYILQKTCNIFLKDKNQDFILSWEPIIYQEIEIIPKGYINFNDVIKNKEIFKKIYDYYIIIISCMWVYLFASWIREIILQMFGFTWMGNSLNEDAEDPGNEITSSMHEIDVDLDTGEITREVYTKQIRNKTTGHTNKVRATRKPEPTPRRIGKRGGFN